MEDLEVEIKGEQKPANLGFRGFLITLLIFFVLMGFSTSYSNSVAEQKSVTSTTSKTTKTSITKSTTTKSKLTSIQVAEKVCPSVVGILVQGKVELESIFGTLTQDISGSGSGFVLSKDGYIATNAHVVKDATQIEVFLESNAKSSYQADIVALDEATDIAVIKLKDAPDLTPVSFGDSNTILRGEKVYAIGNPLGLTFYGSITEGIISGLNRRVPSKDGQYVFDYYIQTDAAMDHGNSGGVLVNEYGEVLGIVTMGFGSTSTPKIGIAIPINEARTVINELIKNKKVTRSTLGVSCADINARIQQIYGIPAGVMITEFTADSSFNNTAVDKNDIITQIDSTEISSISELRGFLAQKSPGRLVTVKLYRPSTHKYFTVQVTLK
ncbi:MAG: trypsin-like peptidase domain-containing protein [Oscillospiraceae bacterium]|nr:trypsin-like peptidase domain-containing protein [Oscillospiraceae bacterium]